MYVLQPNLLQGQTTDHIQSNHKNNKAPMIGALCDTNIA